MLNVLPLQESYPNHVAIQDYCGALLPKLFPSLQKTDGGVSAVVRFVRCLFHPSFLALFSSHAQLFSLGIDGCGINEYLMDDEDEDDMSKMLLDIEKFKGGPGSLGGLKFLHISLRDVKTELPLYCLCGSEASKSMRSISLACCSPVFGDFLYQCAITEMTLKRVLLGTSLASPHLQTLCLDDELSVAHHHEIICADALPALKSVQFHTLYLTAINVEETNLQSVF